MARTWVGAAVVVVAAAGPVVAQPPVPGGLGNPANRPAFSPFLNLNRPGGSFTLNYFGLVRPQIEARQAIQDLNADVLANRQAIGGLEAAAMGGVPTTGFIPTFGTRPPGAFLNSGGYFGTGPGGGGGIVGGAGQSTGALRPLNANTLTNAALGSPANRSGLGGGLGRRP